MKFNTSIVFRHFDSDESLNVVLLRRKVRARFRLGSYLKVFLEIDVAGGYADVEFCVDPACLSEVLPDYQVGQIDVRPEFIIYLCGEFAARKAYGIKVYDPILQETAYFCFPTKNLAFSFMSSVADPVVFSFFEDGDWQELKSPLEWYES